ncbi:MAG: hypothetical protein CM1200mP2_36250 [Planctomycetaceae bacterium]|nr:MAG: hypothetical protein CM1200mP2_36250 [Planctomycetaceae bacterium]
MFATARTSTLVLLALALSIPIGCNLVPQQTLRQSQIRAMHLGPARTVSSIRTTWR